MTHESFVTVTAPAVDEVSLCHCAVVVLALGLRGSVQRGASMEALARGAIQFSHRFTARELRARYNQAHLYSLRGGTKCVVPPSSPCPKPLSTSDLAAKSQALWLRYGCG